MLWGLYSIDSFKKSSLLLGILPFFSYKSIGRASLLSTRGIGIASRGLQNPFRFLHLYGRAMFLSTRGIPNLCPVLHLVFHGVFLSTIGIPNIGRAYKNVFPTLFLSIIGMLSSFLAGKMVSASYKPERTIYYSIFFSLILFLANLHSFKSFSLTDISTIRYASVSISYTDFVAGCKKLLVMIFFTTF